MENNKDTVNKNTISNSTNQDIINLIGSCETISDDLIEEIINTHNNDYIEKLSCNSNIKPNFQQLILEYCISIDNFDAIKNIIKYNTDPSTIIINLINNNYATLLYDYINQYLYKCNISNLTKIINVIDINNLSVESIIKIINRKNITEEILNKIVDTIDYGKKENIEVLGCINNITNSDILNSKINKMLITEYNFRFIEDALKNISWDDYELIEKNVWNEWWIYKSKAIYLFKSLTFEQILYLISDFLKKDGSNIKNKSEFEELLSKLDDPSVKNIAYLAHLNIDNIDVALFKCFPDILLKEKEIAFYIINRYDTSKEGYTPLMKLIEGEMYDDELFMYAILKYSHFGDAYDEDEEERILELCSNNCLSKEVAILNNILYKNAVYRKWVTKIINLKNSKADQKSIEKITTILTGFLKKGQKRNDTSLIQITDEVSLNKKGQITIKPENFDLIDELGKDTIEYGMYPNIEIDEFEQKILDVLFCLKKIPKIQKKYYYIHDGKYVCTPLYGVNGNKYIKISNKWIKLTKLKWNLNHDNGTLELINKIEGLDKLNENDLINFFSKGFKFDIFEPYKITEDESKKHESNKKFKKVEEANKIIKEKKSNDEKSQEIKDTSKDNILKLLKEIDLSVKLLYDQNMLDASNIRKKANIPGDILVIEVGDHREFVPEYIPYLKYIDVSGINCTNLKLSGLNLKETNLYFNPQIIYKKDLSNTILGDHNITFGNFNGVNLCGADLSDEFESSGFEHAIIDKDTKLPDVLKNNL